MRLALDDDQLDLRDTTRRLLQDQCPAAVLRAAWEHGDAAGTELWSALAALGVFGMEAPAALGGMAFGPIETALVLEEVGRAAAPAPVVETAAVAVPILCAVGESVWLPKLLSGEARAAANLDGGALVAHAGSADIVLLAGPAGDCHLVPASECELEPVASVDRGRPLFRVAWSPSPATELGGPDLRLEAFRRGALGTAGALLGLAAALLERAVEYAQARHQFGVPIGSNQAVKHSLANVLVALKHAEPVVRAAAWHVAESTDEAPTYVAIAKARASEAATLASRVALQVHGAIGYTWEHDLHLYMKRAWVWANAWGTPEQHYDAVADIVLARRGAHG